jgi:hypothetical protein
MTSNSVKPSSAGRKIPSSLIPVVSTSLNVGMALGAWITVIQVLRLPCGSRTFSSRALLASRRSAQLLLLLEFGQLVLGTFRGQQRVRPRPRQPRGGRLRDCCLLLSISVLETRYVILLLGINFSGHFYLMFLKGAWLHGPDTCEPGVGSGRNGRLD